MDISDIENAIVDALAATLFDGAYQAGDNVVSTVEGNPQIRLYRGWPLPSDLNADLAAGAEYLPDSERIVNVTVFSLAGMVSILPAYQRDWIITAEPSPTVSATVQGLTVALSGVQPSPGTVVGISLTPASTGVQVGYAYRVMAGDSLSGIAQSLAASIPGALAAQSSITLPAGYRTVWAGSVADSTATMELRRQSQTMQVSVWANSPAIRDAVSGTVDVTMSTIDRLTINGIVTGPLTYKATKVIDDDQATRLWRRDLTYQIAYPTTTSKTVPRVLFPSLSLGPASAASQADGSMQPGKVKIITTTIGPKYPD